MIRFFDIIFSFIGLLILSPFLILISLLILFTSEGPIFFLQERVGFKGLDFKLFKFRTMVVDSDKKGLLTVGGRDPRITSIGYFLRKYKLDELPQLINVLFGSMSLVGPRPEVRKYVELYSAEEKKVLNVKPGITDYASLEYFNENELLAKSSHPEETYIKEIMPAKIKLNKRFIENRSVLVYFSIIFKTIARIVN